MVTADPAAFVAARQTAQDALAKFVGEVRHNMAEHPTDPAIVGPNVVNMVQSLSSEAVAGLFYAALHGLAMETDWRRGT